MIPETCEAAYRATLDPRWSWTPGMKRLRYAPGKKDHLKNEGRVPDFRDTWGYEAWAVVPDLDDPATIGCILALIRSVSNDPRLRVRWSKSRDEWQVVPSDRRGPVYDPRSMATAHGPTEGLAMAAVFTGGPDAAEGSSIA